MCGKGLARSRVRADAARLHLFALVYNLANSLRQWAPRRSIRSWNLTTLRKKVVTIGARVVNLSKYILTQFVQVVVLANSSRDSGAGRAAGAAVRLRVRLAALDKAVRTLWPCVRSAP